MRPYSENVTAPPGAISVAALSPTQFVAMPRLTEMPVIVPVTPVTGMDRFRGAPGVPQSEGLPGLSGTVAGSGVVVLNVCALAKPAVRTAAAATMSLMANMMMALRVVVRRDLGMARSE